MERSSQNYDSLMFRTVPKEEDDFYYRRLLRRQKNASDGGMSSPTTSLFAFVLCVLIYTSIFYIFNISPSSLIFNNNSKFWFFISNTLIFIIAVDYGSFSSSSSPSKRKLDDDHLYDHDQDQYVDKTKTWEISSVAYHELYDTCSGGWESDDEVDKLQQSSRLNKKHNNVPRHHVITHPAISSLDGRKLGGRKLSDENRQNTSNGNFPPPPLVNDHDQWEIIVHDDDEGSADDDDDEENNEYSAMSDEELNKRVEEFIAKLKRQID